MQIIDANPGNKIAYSFSGSKITLGDDELTLNLEKYERDTEVCINVCHDENMLLTSTLAHNFVANIVLPARKYTAENEPIPFDVDGITLHLWALEAEGGETA